MRNSEKKYAYGRTSDVTMYWLTKENGDVWEIWRQLAENWLKEQKTSIETKIGALALFFEKYLIETAPWAADIDVFFNGTSSKGWQASTEGLKTAILENTNRSDNYNLSASLNYTKSFIDWTLENHLFEEDDRGLHIPLYTNPLEKHKARTNNKETVHSPLPYRYICDLRHILCPEPRGNEVA